MKLGRRTFLKIAGATGTAAPEVDWIKPRTVWLISTPEQRDLVEALIEEALALLRAHPAIVEARKQAHAWSDSARDLLASLPAGPARDVLALLCDYVVSRTG